MSDTHASFQQAKAALQAFAAQVAEPVVALVNILGELADAESALATLQLQITDAKSQLDELNQHAGAAQAKLDALLQSIEQDRKDKLAESDRLLTDHRERVQKQIDAVYVELDAAKSSTKTELDQLAAQIAQRRTEQRELDAKIAKRQQLLAELTTGLIHTGVDVSEGA